MHFNDRSLGGVTDCSSSYIFCDVGDSDNSGSRVTFQAQI